jgi:ubiquinone/menaquinone biosynthesis C-methylase UbiE
MTSPTEDRGEARERVAKAKRLFDRPGIYLRNDAHIDIRKRATRELLQRVDGRIADVGCGDGRVSLQFLQDGAQVTLVDPSPAMLDLARARVSSSEAARVAFVQSTLDDFRTEAPFDVVLLLGVLAHVPDVPGALAHLATLVRPGGRVCVQITDHEEPTAQLTHALYLAKKRIWDRSGYRVHSTRGTEILKTAHEVRLRPLGVRQYWVLPPGTGHLPVAWGRRLLHALYASEAASSWGMEKVLLLQKQ